MAKQTFDAVEYTDPYTRDMKYEEVGGNYCKEIEYLVEDGCPWFVITRENGTREYIFGVPFRGRYNLINP